MASKNEQLVVFKVGRELYGTLISEVKEIVNLIETSSIPQTPKYMTGIASMRGNITAIYDLGEKFNLGARTYNEQAKIIVANGSNMGVVVDEVKGIIHVEDQDVNTIESLYIGNGGKFIEGFVKSKENVITILNLKKIGE